MPKRQSKECSGCGNTFITYKDYDYCQNCTINNTRYVQQQCPECGDRSGKVKFPNQKSRPCKICSLTLKSRNKKLNPKNFETSEAQFWNEVKEQSKNLIASLMEKVLPISALPKVFDLEKDVDYRVLLRDDLPNYYSESEEYQEKMAHQSWTLEDIEEVAQNLTCQYFDIAVHNLTDWLSPYSGFESTTLAHYYE